MMPNMALLEYRGYKKNKDEETSSTTVRGAKRQPEPALPPAGNAETKRRRKSTQTNTYPGQGGICTMVLKPLKVKAVHLEWL